MIKLKKILSFLTPDCKKQYPLNLRNGQTKKNPKEKSESKLFKDVSITQYDAWCARHRIRKLRDSKMLMLIAYDNQGLYPIAQESMRVPNTKSEQEGKYAEDVVYAKLVQEIAVSIGVLSPQEIEKLRSLV